MRLHLALAAWSAAAAAALDSSRSYVRSSDLLLSARDALLLPYVTQEADSGDVLRRQDGRGSSSVNLTPGNALNSTDWDRETNAACVNALGSIPRSTNPSGNCLCYNLPSLDTQSGVFRCEIRVYRISEPRDGFAGVSPSNINVGVQYNGASVSPVSAAEFNSMGPGANPKLSTTRPTRRDETKQPQLLQTYQFVGQIDKSRMTEKLSM